MIASLLSAVLKRSLSPFVLTPPAAPESARAVANLGLYVHVPFCAALCPFCPYFKELFARATADAFVDALLMEIRRAGAEAGHREVTSVYFGGGTPALLLDQLPHIAGARQLADAGFDMVSVGVQSFNRRCLHALGRCGDYTTPAFE